MLSKHIIYFSGPAISICDGKCNKAWGMNGRPTIHFDKNNEPIVGRDLHGNEFDRYAFLPDQLLGEAPEDPGTYEGGYGKPNMEAVNADPELKNKWCVRECERDETVHSGELIQIREFSTFRFNNPKLGELLSSQPDFLEKIEPAVKEALEKETN